MVVDGTHWGGAGMMHYYVTELNPAKGFSGQPDSVVQVSLLSQMYFSWTENAYTLSVK